MDTVEIVAGTESRDICEDLLSVLGLEFTASEPGVWTATVFGVTRFFVRDVGGAFHVSWRSDPDHESALAQRSSIVAPERTAEVLERHMTTLGWQVRRVPPVEEPGDSGS